MNVNRNSCDKGQVRAIIHFVALSFFNRTSTGCLSAERQKIVRIASKSKWHIEIHTARNSCTEMVILITITHSLKSHSHCPCNYNLTIQMLVCDMHARIYQRYKMTQSHIHNHCHNAFLLIKYTYRQLQRYSTRGNIALPIDAKISFITW